MKLDSYLDKEGIKKNLEKDMDLSFAEKQKNLELVKDIIKMFTVFTQREIDSTIKRKVTKYNKRIHNYIYNGAPESLEYINLYYEIYEKISLQILEYNIKNNKNDYKGKNKHKLREEIEKNVFADKMATLAYMGKYIIQDYENDIPMLLNKYQLKPINLDSIINHYLLIKQGKNRVKDMDLSIKKEAKKNLIRMLIDSNESKEEFCVSKNLSTSFIDTITKELSNDYPEIVAALEEKYQKDAKKNYFLLNNIYYKIVGFIKDGIETSEGIVNFTILDYLCLTTKVSPRELRDKIAPGKEMSEELYNRFQKLDNSYWSKTINLNMALVCPTTINSELITSQEIETLYNILYENRIPVTKSTMAAIVHRYANNISLLPLKNVGAIRKLKK